MDQRQYTVEELLELAHKHKALHIKVGPLEVQLSPDAFEPAPAKTQTEADDDAEPIPTPDQMLFMAGLEFVPADEQEEG